MIRDILNHLGEKIGDLEFPDGTGEDAIERELAFYALPPQRVVPYVTPRQFRYALFLSGISIESIHSAIEQLDEPNRTLANIGLEYATLFERHNEIVNLLGPAVGLNSEELDNLWLLAATL